MEQYSPNNPLAPIAPQKNPELSAPISWKAILAGVLVALFGYMLLSAAGAAVGGLTISHVIDQGKESAGSWTGAGVWLGLSSVVALFLGSYFGTRYSTTDRLHNGIAQGIITAAIFFLVVIQGAGNMIGSLGGMALSLNTPLSGVATDDMQTAARIVGDTGLIFFATMLFGVIASAIGGHEGAHGNRERPLGRSKVRPPMKAIMKSESGSVAPYVLGWFLGIPSSVLLLIFLLRGCH